MSPELYFTRHEFSPGHSSVAMRAVLDESKPSVLRLVLRRRVNNYVHNAFCNFHHFVHDLVLLNLLGNTSDKKPTIVYRATNSNTFPFANFVIVQSLDTFLGVFLVSVNNESVSAILSVKIHHESDLVDFAKSFKYWNQFIFVQITRNFAYKNFTSTWRGWCIPTRWRSISSLPVELPNRIFRSIHELSKSCFFRRSSNSICTSIGALFNLGRHFFPHLSRAPCSHLVDSHHV